VKDHELLPKIIIVDMLDRNQISREYRGLVLQAYNSGITTGVNE